MSATYTIAPFLGERRKFALQIDEAKVLEEELDCGVLFLEAIFRARQQKLKQIQKILVFGLIGGGMDEGTAIDKVELALEPGAILRYVELCHLILVRFIGTADDEDAPGEGERDENFPEPPQSEAANP